MGSITHALSDVQIAWLQKTKEMAGGSGGQPGGMQVPAVSHPNSAAGQCDDNAGGQPGGTLLPAMTQTKAGPLSTGPAAGNFHNDLKSVTDAQKGFISRYHRVVVTYEMQATYEPFRKALDILTHAVFVGIKKHDLSDAVNAIPAVETTLKALEQDAEARAKDLPQKQKAAADAGDKIDKMSDDDISKMKPGDKAALVKQILGAGKPTGKLRDAQKKLFRNTDIDPKFRDDDRVRQDKVAADLKDDKELSEARGKWGSLDKDGLRRALTIVVAAQSKEYGIPPPLIVFFPDEEEPNLSPTADPTGGFFSSKDGKLHINTGVKAFKDFKETIDTVLHENMHHYQDELVNMLRDGSLKSSDPRRDQALMFEVNNLDPGGYIDAAESGADYRVQPVERSAYETGTATVGKVIAAMKPPADAP
jgi:hypothetical protein